MLLLFTLPLLVGNVFQQAYQFTDAIVVGQFVGVEGLAAVGAGGSLIFFLMGMVWGSSSGLAIPVAKAFGARDMAGTRKAIAGGAYVALGIAFFVTFVGLVFGQSLLRLVGAPADIIQQAWVYLAITFGGSVTAVAFNYLAAAIRAVGDAKTPLYFLIASSILNALLAILFVGVFHWGMAGAAATTIVGQSAASWACVVYVKRRHPSIIPSKSEWREGLKYAGAAARMGLPMGLNVSVIAIGAVILQMAVNGLGTDSVAAFTAGVRVEQLATSIVFSFGIAITTFVAQNRGAKEWARIRIAVAKLTAIAVGTTLVAGMLIMAFSSPLVSLFVRDDAPAQVYELANLFLSLNGWFIWVFAVKFIVRGGIQGLGNALIPTIGSAFELVARAVIGIFFVGTHGFAIAALAGPIAWASSLFILIPTWIVLRRRLLVKERDALTESLTVPTHVLVA